MCLHTKMTIEQCDEWLEDKRKTITAYKVVRVSDRHFDGLAMKNRVYPPIYKSHGSYQRVNKVEEVPIVKSTRGSTTRLAGRRYKAGYHLMLYKKGAEKWRKWVDRWDVKLIILKCKVPRDAIVAIGTQSDETAVVTKEFTFVEGLEYFGEELACA